MPTNKQTTSVINRKCEECTTCCEGALTANIEGHEIFPGRPCHFLGKKCTIYEMRPALCRNYHCAWILDADKKFPEWMRPDMSGVILTFREWPGGSYLEVLQTDKPISPHVLSWIYEHSAQYQLNMRIRIDGHWHIHGDPQFFEYSRIVIDKMPKRP